MKKGLAALPNREEAVEIGRAKVNKWLLGPLRARDTAQRWSAASLPMAYSLTAERLTVNQLGAGSNPARSARTEIISTCSRQTPALVGVFGVWYPCIKGGCYDKVRFRIEAR